MLTNQDKQVLYNLYAEKLREYDIMKDCLTTYEEREARALETYEQSKEDTQEIRCKVDALRDLCDALYKASGGEM